MSDARARRAATAGAALLLALGLLSVALASLRQPFGPGDYVAIWGLKARALARAGSATAVFHVDPKAEFSHPEYPLLWPLVLAGARAATGGDALTLTLLWPLLAAAAAFFAARAARGPLAVRLLAAALVALLPYYRVYAGYADALLAVFLLAAACEATRLGEEPGWGAVLRLAALLGFAASTKNEGVLAAGIAVLLLASARRWKAASAAVACVALAVVPWQIAVANGVGYPPPGDFAARAFSLSNLAGACREIGSEVAREWPYAAAAAALLGLAPATRRRRRGLLVGAALFTAAIVLSYGFSRLDVRWHVLWSFDRLGFLVLVCLAPVLAEAAGEALAEAPPA